ncbi:MAG TPA: 4'-phosphopantetheinyl transferase superfamily protein [Arenimonas sp.]|nr:4'-phosphopantetheinyl transferase superfamily protein [Arenimonas sp.]
MAEVCLVDLVALSALPEDAELGACLGVEERARLQHMRAPQRRRQFLAGHWLARQLTCERFGGEPADWCWHTENSGKPRLLCAGRVVEIAVTHSAEYIACAVAAEPIGLDLEIRQRERDWRALARHALSEVEALTIAALPPVEHGTAFIERWALHEAWGKRAGEGVLLSRMRRRRFIESEPQTSELRSWSLPEGSLALAVSAEAIVECRGIEPASAPGFWRCLQSQG